LFPHMADVRSPTPVPNLRQCYLQAQGPQQNVARDEPRGREPCYHAHKLKQQLLAKQAHAVEPFRKVKGQWVDYWSEYHRCWIPASILDVDPESGGIVLDVKPGTALRLHDQWKIRPRRMPTPEQVSAVHSMLANVELELQAERFFSEIGRAKTESIQSLEDVMKLGDKVNCFVGLLGCQVHLKVKMQSQGFLSFDDFRMIFSDVAHLQQDMSVQALQKDVAETAIPGTPDSRYQICETLGKGTYGEVVKAKDKQTRQTRAIKIINKEKVHGDMAFLKQEIQNLIQLDHPHVLKLLEFYNSEDRIFLVTDHCSRGELHKHICDARDSRKPIPQVWIAHVVQQLLSAVTHIHANGIIHLDVKSQNIMLMPALETKMRFVQAEPNEAVCSIDIFKELPHIIVIDLGVATIFQPGNFKRGSPMGTPSTMAPEVWRGEITPKADVFSCGCVLFELLSFQMPWDFKYRGNKQEARNFWEARPRPHWERVQRAPVDAQSLMAKMLEQERPKRMNAADGLREPFVSLASDGIPVTQMEKGLKLINRLVTTCERDAFYKLICLKIAQDWPPNEMPSFKSVFKEFDDEGTGMLQDSVLVRKFVSCGYEEQQAKRAAVAMNLSQNKNAVDWTEFVAACIDLGNPKLEPSIHLIFHNADKDNDGLLSMEDVQSLLPEAHRNAREAAQGIFIQITGRASETGGERMDWHSFVSYLRRQARAGMPEEPIAEVPEPENSPDPKVQNQDILRNVTDAIRATAAEAISTLSSVGHNWFGAKDSSSERGYGGYAGYAAGPPEDKVLRHLLEMGYEEPAVNAKVLQWCRQQSCTAIQLDDRLYTELDRQYAHLRARRAASPGRALQAAKPVPA
ncbi:CPK4, partial [Symbiodinium microadriaticum]